MEKCIWRVNVHRIRLEVTLMMCVATVISVGLISFFFFFNNPPPPEIYTLSLPSPLPVWGPSAATPPPSRWPLPPGSSRRARPWSSPGAGTPPHSRADPAPTRVFRDNPLSIPRSQQSRSEEHTSELQSQSNLVCSLLLEQQ